MSVDHDLEREIDRLSVEMQDIYVDGWPLQREGARRRIVDWLGNFDGLLAERHLLLEILRGIQIVYDRNILIDCRKFLEDKRILEGRNYRFTSFGSQDDSSARIIKSLYRTQHYAPDLEKLLVTESEVGDPPLLIVFIDDFLNSGGQFRAILDAWMADDQDARAPRARWQLTEPARSRLRRAELLFLFAHGTVEGLFEAEDCIRNHGLNAKVYCLDQRSDKVGLFGTRDDLEAIRRELPDVIGKDSIFRGRQCREVTGFLRVCEAAGEALLRRHKPEWSNDKVLNRRLGYGDSAKLYLTEANVPTCTLTCLWLGGRIQVNGVDVDWKPLIPRHDKTEAGVEALAETSAAAPAAAIRAPAVAFDAAPQIRNWMDAYVGEGPAAPPFGGRDRDIDALDAWRDDPHGTPYLLLAAPPGRGKSALLAHWISRWTARGDWRVVFVPVSVRFGTHEESATFAALSAELERVHFGEALPNDRSSASRLRQRTAGLLQRPPPAGCRLLVVIDGLDESAAAENQWAGVLPTVPPPGLRVALSARAEPGRDAHAAWLARLGWSPSSPLVTTRSLDVLDRAGVADVLARAGLAPRERPDDDLTDEVLRLTEGDPLVLGLYVEALRRSGHRVRPSELREVKPGLDGWFLRWWREQRQLWGDRQPQTEPLVRALLRLLAVAEGPLRDADLAALAPAELSDGIPLDAALAPLARLVIGDARREGIMLGHPRLGEFLRAELLGADDVESTRSRFLDWGRTQLARLRGGEMRPEQAPVYLVRYLGRLIARAPGDFESTLALLGDEWRRAHAAVDRDDDGFLADVERAGRAASVRDADLASRGAPAACFSTEVGAALCSCSARAIHQSILPELGAALVRAGQWTLERGIAHVRAIDEPSQRTKGFGDLARVLDGAERDRMLRLAGREADVLDPTEKAHALCALLEYLPGPEREAAVAEVDRIAAGQPPEVRLRLAVFAEPFRVPSRRDLRGALARARAIPGLNGLHAQLWLVPHLPSGELAAEAARLLEDPLPLPGGDVLAGMDASFGEMGSIIQGAGKVMRRTFLGIARFKVVVHLSAFLDEATQQRALALAADDPSGELRAAVEIVGLLKQVPPDVESALAKVRSLEFRRTEALVLLVPRLGPASLPLAVEAAACIADAEAAIGAVEALLPWTTPPVRARFVEAVLSRLGGSSRVGPLVAAGRFDDEEGCAARARTIETVRSITNEAELASALETLTKAEWPDTCSLLVDQFARLSSPAARCQAAAAMLKHGPAAVRAAIAADALVLARDTTLGGMDRESLASLLASHLPDERVDDVRDAIESLPDDKMAAATAALARRLPLEESLRLTERALTRLAGHPIEFERGMALQVLAPALQPQQIPAAFQVALGLDPGTRFTAIVALMRQMPPRDRRGPLQNLLRDAGSIAQPIERAITLARLLELWPPDDRRRVLKKTLTALDRGAATVGESAFQYFSSVLTDLLPYLAADPGLLDRATQSIEKVRDSYFRASLRSVLVPVVGDDVVAEWVRSALSRSDDADSWSEEFFSAVVPRLSTLPAPRALQLLRRQIELKPTEGRKALLHHVGQAADAIACVAGPAAASATAAVILDVTEWWP